MMLNAFYRLHVPAPLAFEAVDEVPCAPLGEVESRPDDYIDHLLKRAERTPPSSFNHRTFYDFRLRIRTKSGWRSLDPSDGGMPTNEWRTLRSILRRVGTRVFDTGRIEPPPSGPWEQRHNFAWSVEDDLLWVRRRILVSDDPADIELFRVLNRDRTPEAAIPATLWRESQRLNGRLREEVDRYPLCKLALEARRLLERLVILNHFLYFKTIDALMKRFDMRHPYEACTWHLVNEVVPMERDAFVDRVRAVHPDFALHPTLKGESVAAPLKPQPREIVPPPPGPPAKIQYEPGAQPDLELAEISFHAHDYPETLKTALDFIRCELHFHRWAMKGDLDGLEAAAAAEALVDLPGDLAGTWSSRTAVAVDPEGFWLKQVWIESPQGGRSTSKMGALRYALYDPPYGGASKLEISLLEAEIFDTVFGADHDPSHFDVWSVDPKGSSFFINEWWDYCWVLFNRRRREAIVIYGTATD